MPVISAGARIFCHWIAKPDYTAMQFLLSEVRGDTDGFAKNPSLGDGRTKECGGGADGGGKGMSGAADGNHDPECGSQERVHPHMHSCQNPAPSHILWGFHTFISMKIFEGTFCWGHACWRTHLRKPELLWCWSARILNVDLLAPWYVGIARGEEPLIRSKCAPSSMQVIIILSIGIRQGNAWWKSGRQRVHQL